MILKSLELLNYRNYETLKLDFDTGTNIFYGDNAQGKTNILEAVYLSGTTKSHRGSKDKEIISFDKEESHIKTIVEKNEREFQIDIHLKKKGAKGIAVNKVPIKKAGDLFGILNVVVFSPEDLYIIKEGPQMRRRFMDMELCQIDKIYLSNLAKYNKIIAQRNKLLKDIYYKPELKNTLDIWDLQLVEYGKKIVYARDKFIKELMPVVADIHSKLTGDKEKLEIVYTPDAIEDELESKVRENREKDLRFGTTSVGPHHDDISFLIDNTDIRKYGSQGQQRTSALSLKLSELKIVEDIIKDKPILLMDDVLSELDKNRQTFLLNNIKDTQTIVTCTGLDEFVKNRFEIDKIFNVVEGHVYENKEIF